MSEHAFLSREETRGHTAPISGGGPNGPYLKSANGEV